MKVLMILCLSLLILSACATRQGVVVDPKGVEMDKYQDDLAQCEQISKQVDQKAAGRAVGGAIVGGLVGGVIGNNKAVKTGAGLGAISGAVRGGAATKRERNIVVKNCMRHRGYVVLN